MTFLKEMADRVFNRYSRATKKDFKTEYRMLGNDMVEEMLKEMEGLDLISIERSNGNVLPKYRKRFEILK